MTQGNSAISSTLDRKHVVTGLFPDRPSAERAFRAARAVGYAAEEIDVVMNAATHDREFSAHSDSPLEERAHVEGESSGDAAELGGPSGATAATLAPALAAVGATMLVPGLIFAGPVALALAAGGAVGVVGGLAGALTHWGVPGQRVEEYEAGIRAGSILLGVSAHSNADANEIESAWRDAGGTRVHT